jgi:cytidylate kinase
VHNQFLLSGYFLAYYLFYNFKASFPFLENLESGLWLSRMEMKKIITIDGPAGAGKSTVSKAVAKKLGYIYLDTGALYRALAYKALKVKISIDDRSALSDLCSRTKVALKYIDGQLNVYVDGEDVGEKIRTEEVGLAASKISTYAIVRESLLNLQREVGIHGGLVAEGRDMGSVVFPNADCKFYLVAKGNSVEYQAIQKDILDRDKQDEQRQLAPLKVPDGAIIIDSTDLSAQEVVEKVINYILVK